MMFKIVLLYLVGFTAGASAQSSNAKFFKKLGEYKYTDSNNTNRTSTYYSRLTLRLSWPAALTFCNSFGMNLLMFETEAEQNFLLDHLWKNWRNELDLFNHIGGARNESNTDQFFWVPSGQPVNFTLKWGFRQPDNYLRLENCLSIQREISNLAINDSPCLSDPFYTWKFICEKTE